jgi:hypothetical protein
MPLDEKQAKRIGGVIRQLASSEVNQVEIAKQMLGSMLQGTGRDVILALAERIEHPGELDESEAQQIHDAGVKIGIEIGRKQEQAKQATTTPPDNRLFHGSPFNSPSLPHPHVMATYCFDRINRLAREKEREFIDDMVERTRRPWPLSPKQLDWLEDIYHRLGGS